jgi:segregation and condensation protein A
MRIPAPTFNLEDFEGPLDLLLHLVENKELDIYRVIIEQILTQYETHLKAIKTHDLDLAAEFLSIISSLMLLKSKTLLPQEKEENEDPSESILRLDIIEQLVHYYKFRDMAKSLSEKENSQASKYLRGVNTEFLFDEREPELKATPESVLSELFLKVLEKKRLSDTRFIEEEDYRVSDKIKELKTCLKQSKYLVFEEVFSYKKPKGELIALFIALLEILKQGNARLNQSENQWIIEPKED